MRIRFNKHMNACRTECVRQKGWKYSKMRTQVDGRGGVRTMGREWRGLTGTWT